MTLFTYADAGEYVLDRFDLENAGSPSAKDYRLVRRAIRNALTLLPSKHEWNFLKRTITIRTEASYSTGTIAYDASTRTVTLSGGTWPTNAALGWIRYGDDHWFVQTRSSDTVVVLRSEGAPAYDVAAGASYEWYRDSYPLPCRVRHLEPLFDADDYSALQYVSHGMAQMSKFNYGGRTHQRPYVFSYGNDDRYADTMSVLFAPPPSQARHYHFTGIVEPRALNVYEYNTGTVSVAAGTATCTITTGAFDTALHPGTLIRFGTALALPTSPYGSIAGAYNPAAYERRIISVESTSSCTLDAAITAGVTNVKFTISDPIDIFNDSMLPYFWALCNHEMAKLYYKESNAIKGFMLNEEQRQLLLAMDADRIYRGPMNTDYFGGNARSAIGTVDINDN